MRFAPIRTALALLDAAAETVLLAALLAAWAVSPVRADSGPAARRVPAGPRPVPGWPVIVDNSIRHPLAAADIDGDGGDEIAVCVKDCRVLILDGDGRAVPGWPRETSAWPVTGPMMEDIDGDGEFEIAVCTMDGRMHLWRENGDPVPGWPLDLGDVALSTPVAVRDGASTEAAMLVAVRPGVIRLLFMDGTERSGWPLTAPGSSTATNFDRRPVAAADLDGDGTPEILHLSTEPAVLSAWRLDGSPFPGYPLELAGRGGLGIAVDDPAAPARIACATERGLYFLEPGGVIAGSAAPPDERCIFYTAPWFVPSSPESGARADLVVISTEDDRVCVFDAGGGSVPGWPVRLDGFVYGVTEKDERHTVYGPPVACDADGDGELEIVLGSYDHHLYCFELDGTPVPGWPEVVEDFIMQGVALADLDGDGAGELVVGQYGETVFAWRLGRPETPGTAAGGGARGRYSEWPPIYFAVSATILGMIALLAWLLRRELAGPSGIVRGMILGSLIILLAALAVRLVFFADDLYRYRQAGGRLERAEPDVAEVLRAERERARELADRLAAGLPDCDASRLRDPLRSLRCLERLADRNRLEYRFAGILLADRSGRVVQGVGLGRGWSTLEELGLSSGVPTDPILLDDVPVFAAESESGVVSEDDTLRFFVLASLLNTVPTEIVDRTGFSAHIRVDGRTVAWGGAGQRPFLALHPWLGSVQPAREIDIVPGAGGGRTSILLVEEDFERPLSQWLDLAAVIVLPCLYLLLMRRRRQAGRIGLRGWWLAAFAALYIAGAVLLQQGRIGTGPVPAAGRVLEVMLHMLGVTGLVVALYRVATSQRSRQLSFSMLGSYLMVSLIPLAVLILVGANLLAEIQRGMLERTIEELETRADNLVLAYMGNMGFTWMLGSEAPTLLAQSPETSWLNFVAENQYLFNYDLPTAYLTLWVKEREAPGRFFTGYSYRAPRTGKLYYERPAWARDRSVRGLFLDNGTAVIRAMRTLRHGPLDAAIVSHIPIDEAIMGEMETRLRGLPILPRIHLEPAWLESTVERPRPDGWPIPYERDLVLRARDWRSGNPRLVVYRAGMYLPPGAGMLRVILPALLLLLIPLGLSFWGAYSTYQRTARPLARLLTGIRRVGAGDLEYRLGEAGGSEIGRTVRAFDAMAASLEKTVSELADKRKVEEVSELKSRFISMVSHDLKTPLSSIRGAAENILEEVAGPVTDRQRTYLDMILQSSGDLQKMIGDMLDLSRIESGRLELHIEQVDLRPEADDLLRSMRPILDGKRIGGRVSVQASAGTVVPGDRTRIWQVLSNVLGNSIRYSPEGGTIEIRIEDAPPERSGGRAMLMISVIDEGPGISEDEAASLFEPFYYRAHGPGSAHGAGLGLTIVRQLVELHGGSVSLGNATGGGAILSFTLPL